MAPEDPEVLEVPAVDPPTDVESPPVEKRFYHCLILTDDELKAVLTKQLKPSKRSAMMASLTSIMVLNAFFAGALFIGIAFAKDTDPSPPAHPPAHAILKPMEQLLDPKKVGMLEVWAFFCYFMSALTAQTVVISLWYFNQDMVEISPGPKPLCIARLYYIEIMIGFPLCVFFNLVATFLLTASVLQITRWYLFYTSAGQVVSFSIVTITWLFQLTMYMAVYNV